MIKSELAIFRVCALLCLSALIQLAFIAANIAAEPLVKTDAVDDDEVCVACTGEQLGTAITWFRDTKAAARLARDEKKLVFLIQVSGNFARDEFT